MIFGKSRMMKLSGLLREGVEEAGSCECGGAMYEDSGCSECGGAMYEDPTGEIKAETHSNTHDETATYEVDDASMQEIEESAKFRKMIRGELESMWSSGQVFGKKAKPHNGITMGFKGIGFK